MAANDRAACRAYTDRLFVSKLAIVDEEADESEFWFRIIRTAGLQTPTAIGSLELACIFAAAVRTARTNLRQRKKLKMSRSQGTAAT